MSLLELLIQTAVDAESFSVRRFSLSAIGYLRELNTDCLPVLIAGLNDIDTVFEDVKRVVVNFRKVGDINVVSQLVPYLTGESIQTAQGVAQILDVLGRGAFGAAGEEVQNQILAELSAAIEDDSSARQVEEGKTLADEYFEIILKLVGE
jgi:hypothetical protein